MERGREGGGREGGKDEVNEGWRERRKRVRERG